MNVLDLLAAILVLAGSALALTAASVCCASRTP